MYSEKKNTAVYLFIAGSLALFFLLLLSSVSLVLWSNLAQAPAALPPDRYAFKDFDTGDPYTSKNPGLDDLLAGPIISANDPSLGPEDAPVTVVSFSDFACAYCKDQEKDILKAVAQFPDQVRFIRKDYPEGDVTSFSFQAALAGRCAQAQGKFWEFDAYISEAGHDNAETLVVAPEALGLDQKNFTACLDHEAAWNRVLDNMEEANALEISGVPFVYVNRQEFLGGVSSEDLIRAIDQELRSS